MLLSLCSGSHFANVAQKKAVNKRVSVCGCLCVGLTHSVWLQCSLAGAIALREEAVRCTDRLAFEPRCIVRLLKCWCSSIGRGNKKKSFTDQQNSFISMNLIWSLFTEKVCCARINCMNCKLMWPLSFSPVEIYSVNIRSAIWMKKKALRLNIWSSLPCSLMGSTWWAAHWTRL